MHIIGCNDIKFKKIEYIVKTPNENVVYFYIFQGNVKQKAFFLEINVIRS